MSNIRTLIAAAVAAVITVLPVVAQDAPARGGKLAGEVIEIRQSAATQNQGAFTEIRVRTAQRQETWLRLGRAGEMGKQVRLGDRVRARVMAGRTGEPLNVRWLRNDTTGARLTLRSRDGALLRQRDRDRDQTRDRDQLRDRDRARDRDRVHEPGSAGNGGGRGSRGAGRSDGPRAGHRGGRS